MTIQIVTAIIAMIEQFLPILGTPAATVTMIDGIISALEKLMPAIQRFVPVVYNSIKNIVIALKNDPATTKAQWDVLDAIDVQLDADNDAAINAVDPDRPGAGNATA